MKIGLVGNPNVGKSSIFNFLTGSRVHTGNWSGKTVDESLGFYRNYSIVDLPGTYSLISHSKEEDVTSDFVCFLDYDALIFVLDATALSKGLNLLLQVLEVTNKVIVCINMIDLADKRGISIDVNELSNILNVPCVCVSSRKKIGFDKLLFLLDNLKFGNGYKINYDFLEEELVKLDLITGSRFISIRCLILGYSYDDTLNNEIRKILSRLHKKGISRSDVETILCEINGDVCSFICDRVVSGFDHDNNGIIDRFLTGKISGKIVMLLLLFLVFWITISLANYPSEFLYNLFSSFSSGLHECLSFLPNSISNCLVDGVYRVLTWVISVMLPPMAIFFPLFALLEESGYLPRVAFNLDGVFKKCGSCGKQALTMMMGFGCNAVGVMGARIIDSSRERLIAILTNCLVPCNGRFPILIAIITMFLVGGVMGSFVLTLVIVSSVLFTFLLSKILSLTILKGESSAFVLEMPSYKRPLFLRTIVNSFFEKTLFVLKRAVFVSIPFGFLIYLVSNIYIGGESILSICSSFLDPFGRLIGLDGVILIAFILGFPANEIVIPIMIMGYMSLGYITDFSSLNSLKDLLVSNGWTMLTAICIIVLTLIHFPCFTTVLTIKNEIGGRWALFSVLIPFIFGITLCFLITRVYYLFF